MSNTIFASHSDYSIQQFKDERFSDFTAKQSLFNGAVFVDCSFYNISFERSDFEGARFFNCTFDRVGFVNTEIRSAVFSDSHLSECDFSEATIEGCAFTTSSISKCNFGRALVSDSQMKDCVYFACLFQTSTHSLNRFDNCRFKCMCLGDCSFGYHIIRDCSFEDCEMNIDTLGTSYGLTLQNLTELGYIFLGRHLGKPKGDIVSIAEDFFADRNWNLHLRLLQLSTKKVPSYDALNSIFDVVVDNIAAGKLVTRASILFLKELLYELYNSKALPFFSVLYALSKMMEIDRNAFGVDNKTNVLRDALTILINSLSSLFNSMVSDYSDAIIENIGYENRISLILHCYDKMLKTSDVIIEQLIDEYGRQEWKGSKFIEYRSGSILEILATTVGGVFLLQLFLFGVNGCLIQLTEFRGRAKILFQKGLPDTYKNLVVTPKQNLPKEAINILSSLTKVKVMPSIVKAISQYADNVIDASIEDLKETPDDQPSESEQA